MIPISKPLIGKKELEAVSRPILSGWVMQGPEVNSFEVEFAEYVKSKFACAVSSCTSALHLALKAVGVSEGDEVITVSHSYIATANSIRYCGAIPVFVDILPDTFNINTELIENVITKKTRAILCVHQMGMPCNLKKILKIARKHNLPVVEDAACAIGSEINWQGNWEKIGKPHGDIACFSFHPRKIITTGEGGMLTTNDPGYDKKCRLLRQHSMGVADTTLNNVNSFMFNHYTELGYNYRMTDIQASIGRVQLQRLPLLLERRRHLAKRYIELLSRFSDFSLPSEEEWAWSNWQSFCVRLPEGVNQRAVMQKMLEKGISTRSGIVCAHCEPAYRQEPWRSVNSSQKQNNLEESEKAQEESIIIPLYYDLSYKQQNYIIKLLKEFCLFTPKR